MSPRPRHRPPARIADARFSRTVAEEVRYGIAWQDYRHRLSRFLLPTPDDDAVTARERIELARQHELRMDAIEPGEPGSEPAWPTWRGLP
jgi:hypothetical protein